MFYTYYMLMFLHICSEQGKNTDLSVFRGSVLLRLMLPRRHLDADYVAGLLGSMSSSPTDRSAEA